MSRAGAHVALDPARRTAAAAVLLVGRRIVVAVLAAVATSVTARELGAGDFGQLSAALATYYLVAAACDLGFSQVVVRRLAVFPQRRGAVARTAVRVALTWSGLLTAGTVLLAGQSGLGRPRGLALLVLAPAVLISGLLGLRQVFLVADRVRLMTAVDLATNVLQAALLITLALAGFNLVWLAAVTAAGVIGNTVVCALLAVQLVDPGRPERDDVRGFVREAVPLGLASVLSSAYFGIDLVLVGHLAPARAVGEYAAAVKVLSILVSVPGIIVGAALPGFSLEVADRNRLSLLVSRVWHLMAATALPACVAVGLFAPPVVALLFGRGYSAAAPLLRVLALAALLSLVNNVLASVLLALGRGPRMLVMNLAALVLNVALNVALVPRYGVAVAAWATLATEALVVLLALAAVTDRLRLRPSLLVSARPGLAIGAGILVGVALARWPWPAALAGGVAYLAVLTLLGGWPGELRAVLGGR